MFKKIKIIMLVLLISANLFVPSAAAVSILPGKTTYIENQCPDAVCQCADGGSCDYSGWCSDYLDTLYDQVDEGTIAEWVASQDMPETTQTILFCGISSGEIQLWMIPFYVRNILEFIISIAGLISVLMVIVGAYYYIAGGISDDKEKGKTIIKYAIGGLIVSTLSWFIVNMVLLIVTS